MNAKLEAHPAHPVARTVGAIVLFAFIVALLLTLFYQIGSAFAQGSGSAIVPPVAIPPDLDADMGGFLQQTFAAVRSGDWTAVTAAVLIGIVWAARKPWALGRWAFFKTDRGGVLMAFGISLVGGYGHAIAATHDLTPDLQTLKAIGMTAVTAMGGYVALKRLIWPADKAPSTPSAPATEPPPPAA